MATRADGRPAAPAKHMAYADRVARYERIKALRAQDEPVPYEDIGAMFSPPLTRERVRQIAEGGRPAKGGRPGRADRAEVMRRKLAEWERRLANRKAKGLPTEEAERRVAEWSAELARVTG